MASMVVTRFPTAAETGVMQDRVGRPSIWIVHAPQRPWPQPNFVPVMVSTSRSVHSKGISSGTSRLRAFPFTLSVIIGSPSRLVTMDVLDESATALVNPLHHGIGQIRRHRAVSTRHRFGIDCSEGIGRYHRPIDPTLCVWCHKFGPGRHRPFR